MIPRFNMASGYKNGAALLTVLVALMIISMLLMEFQYASMVERKLAYNELNQLQAYYLAKSGIRMGLLRVMLYARARKSGDLKKAFGNLDIKPLLEPIWSLPLPAFPPPATSLGKLTKEDKDAAEKVLEQTRVTEGQVTHIITSEASKINLNYLGEIPPQQRNDRINLNCQTPQALYQYVACLLVNLLENFLRDSDDPYQEYGNLRPEEVALSVMDWVNPGGTSFLGGSKDSFYEQQKPPYKAKRNRLYTLDELKLVKGIDDYLFNKLRPHVTVYSYDGKINLNTAGANIYRAMYRDFTEDDIKRILEERTRLNGWATEKQFVEFVKGQLGRSGFEAIYKDEKTYPFTVSSQSFLIESLGIVRKSKSQIQKTIRVAVALTTGRSGSQVASPSKSECEKDPNNWWDPRTAPNLCKTKPRKSQDCVDQAGQWDETKKCCGFNTPGGPIIQVCVPQTSGQTQTAAQEPNAVKILYWSES